MNDTDSKVIISLLVRLYDVHMGILSHLDKDTADKIYDAHDRGEHYHPNIFLLDISNMSNEPEEPS